jgi:hypothetical protein
VVRCAGAAQARHGMLEGRVASVDGRARQDCLVERGAALREMVEGDGEERDVSWPRRQVVLRTVRPPLDARQPNFHPILTECHRTARVEPLTRRNEIVNGKRGVSADTTT